MRAYPYARISVVIAVLIAACVVGALLVPQNAVAKEPNYKMYCSQNGGGTSGGGEWRKPPGQQGQGGIPVDRDGTPGPKGKKYSTPKAADAQPSWAEQTRSMIVRMVRLVGARFSELF